MDWWARRLEVWKGAHRSGRRWSRCRVISILQSLIPDQTEDPSHDIPNNQLSRLGSDELTADGADSNDELIDIGPFISCDYLEENVGSRYGARFRTLDLPSFKQPGRK